MISRMDITISSNNSITSTIVLQVQVDSRPNRTDNKDLTMQRWISPKSNRSKSERTMRTSTDCESSNVRLEWDSCESSTVLRTERSRMDSSRKSIYSSIRSMRKRSCRTSSNPSRNTSAKRIMRNQLFKDMMLIQLSSSDGIPIKRDSSWTMKPFE